MSERTRNGKGFAQDALGFLFCLVGGFFAVSIVLSMRGQEPRPGLISTLTWPVVELVTLLGPAAGLLFSAGLAALGTLLFLRSTEQNALRPLLALLFGSLGVAFLFGAFGSQSEFGAWLPGLVPGIFGRVLALVLGLALAWLGWTILAVERAPRSSSAELVQRVGLAARHDAAAGVSPAEAALLVSEPRTQPTRPLSRHEAVPRREAVPVRAETIRPFAPPRAAPVSAPRAPHLEVAGGPGREAVEAPPVLSGGAAQHSSSANEPPVSVLAPPVPSWEELPAEELAGQEGDEQRLSATLSGEFETEEEGAPEALELAGEEEEEAGAQAAEAAAPHASWEQIGLFDEEEELEEEAAPVQPARVELTSTFDFGLPESTKPVHEPEPGEEDPFAVAIAPADESEAALADEPEAPAFPAAPAGQQEFLLQPVAAPRAGRSEARDEEGERWSKLVYEAGCAILEQKRVAVSMLERRFGVDFDQACRVLDELQQAGLIGPYMGGRTRDILLTREQWLPHAPQVS